MHQHARSLLGRAELDEVQAWMEEDGIGLYEEGAPPPEDLLRLGRRVLLALPWGVLRRAAAVVARVAPADVRRRQAAALQCGLPRARTGDGLSQSQRQARAAPGRESHGAGVSAAAAVRCQLLCWNLRRRFYPSHFLKVSGLAANVADLRYITFLEQRQRHYRYSRSVITRKRDGKGREGKWR